MELKGTLRTALVLLGTAAVAAACTESSVTPTPPLTELRVSLETPGTDDGALVLVLHGPGIAEVSAASPGYLTYTRGGGMDETRVVVIGDVKGGAVLTLRLAPGHQLEDYSATIQQVATRGDALREDLTGYRLTLSAP
jgi:hypothetical protein